MIFALALQFQVKLLCSGAHLKLCLNSVLNVKVIVGAFNQEKALVVTYSVIVKSSQTFS